MKKLITICVIGIVFGYVVFVYVPVMQKCARLSLVAGAKNHLDVDKIYHLCLKANRYGF